MCPRPRSPPPPGEQMALRTHVVFVQLGIGQPVAATWLSYRCHRKAIRMYICTRRALFHTRPVVTLKASFAMSRPIALKGYWDVSSMGTPAPSPTRPCWRARTRSSGPASALAFGVQGLGSTDTDSKTDKHACLLPRLTVDIHNWQACTLAASTRSWRLHVKCR